MTPFLIKYPPYSKSSPAPLINDIGTTNLIVSLMQSPRYSINKQNKINKKIKKNKKK